MVEKSRAIPTQHTIHINNGKIDQSFVVSTEGILGGDKRYCDRASDVEVGKNLNAIRKVALWVSGLNRRTKLNEIGQYIEAAREGEPAVYDDMQTRAETVCMSALGFDVNNEVERSDFVNIFRTACDAHDAATEELRKRLVPAFNDNQLKGTEMMQEVKYARHPLALFETIFQDKSIQRSHEGTRKLISVIRAIPAIMEQNQFEGVGGDVFAMLRKHNVIGDSPDKRRQIITKVYEDTGEAVEWVPYKPSEHKELRKGEDEKGKWKEMFFAFPSRTSRNGLPVYMTDRDKKDGSSIVLKTMRKLEKHDDHFAVRIVIDETQPLSIKDQLFLIYQDMVYAFEKEGYKVDINTNEGFMNTLSQPFDLIVDGKRVSFPTNVFNAENNRTASPKRRVLQTDWNLRNASNGKLIKFEMQAMDTLADINRALNGEWSDDVYKVGQMFKQFIEKQKPNIANTFFPEYVYGFDVDTYKEELMQYALAHSLRSPNRNKLPKVS